MSPSSLNPEDIYTLDVLCSCGVGYSQSFSFCRKIFSAAMYNDVDENARGTHGARLPNTPDRQRVFLHGSLFFVPVSFIWSN